MHLGRLVDNVSDALLTGLKTGVGLTVAAGQIPALLGIPGGDGGAFFAELGDLVGRVRDLNWPTLALAAATIAVLLGVRRWAPRIPGPLIAVAGGIAASVLLDLPSSGVELIERVPSGLPTPRLPDLTLLGSLLPGAAALALMAALETIVVARTTRLPADPPVRDDRELVAIGVGNAAGAVFGAMPAAGGFSQTAVATGAGARSQAAGLVTVGLAVAVALLLGPVISQLPAATLTAIVVVAVVGLVNPRELVALARLNPIEAAIAVVAAVVALSAGMLAAVAVGVGATLALVVWELDSPELIELVPDSGGRLVPASDARAPEPGLLALRIGAPLYTANARAVSRQVLERIASLDRPTDVVLLDAVSAGRLSSTVLAALRDTGRELAHLDIQLWIAALSPRALALVRRTPAWADIAVSGRAWRTPEEALAAHRAAHFPATDKAPSPAPLGVPAADPPTDRARQERT